MRADRQRGGQVALDDPHLRGDLVPGDVLPIRRSRLRTTPTAIARLPGESRHHSMPIEPVPAPRSHSSSSPTGARLASAAARSTRL
ncbi:MAG: hypothetical protein KIT69_01785 [Propionibacteriaceae bacterium]|nr:hypothetical protein [Propionibacteriaceae bacterium]